MCDTCWNKQYYQPNSFDTKMLCSLLYTPYKTIFFFIIFILFQFFSFYFFFFVICCYKVFSWCILIFTRDYFIIIIISDFFFFSKKLNREWNRKIKEKISLLKRKCCWLGGNCCVLICRGANEFLEFYVTDIVLYLKKNTFWVNIFLSRTDWDSFDPK